MAEGRTPVVGVTSLYVAKMTTEDTATTAPVYDTPVLLMNVKQFGVDPGASQVRYYANDVSLYSFYNEGEKTVTLVGDRLLTSIRSLVYGMTVANGIQEFGSTDVPPYVAIMCSFTRGDGTKDLVCLPKVQLSRSSITVDTKGSEISPQDESLTGSVLNLAYNGLWQTMLNTGNANASSTTISNWFVSPIYSSSQDTSAVTVTAAAGTTGTIVFTFTKANSGTMSINSASLSSTTLPIFLTAGTIQSPTAYTLATVSGSTQTLTVTGLTAGATSYIVTSGVKDVNGVGVTAKAGQITVV